jgi:Cu(I)/Ag(I) efflux system membrane fusion protein
VRVTLENPVVEEGGTKRRLLLHRVYAEGRVSITLPESLVVPRSAVLQAGAQALVYVQMAPGNYQQRTVTLGRVGDDDWEILSGVAEGERVVVQGNLVIDAQAQINRGASSAAPRPAAPGGGGAASGWTPAQAAAARVALGVASDLASALAADDLAAFTAQAEHVAHRLTPALAELAEVPGAAAWTAALGRPVDGATNRIESARAWFLPLAMASVDLARAARRAGAVREVVIYECPMVDDAVPGAPSKAGWVQQAGPKRNPYFGAAMLDCGTEVKD